MKRLLIVLGLFLFAMPFVALADGSTSYATLGTYTFSVPSYGTLTVTVNGAGGGGGGASCGYSVGPISGGSGGASVFYSSTNVIGYGGGGGQGNYTSGGNCIAGAAGSPGSASGGSSNVTGGGAAGGAGGYPTGRAAATGWGSAGPGGAGGRASITFSNGASGAPASGSGITVVVGGGGAAGGTDGYPLNVGGTPGSNGSVSISWTSIPTPSCTVTISPNPSAYSYTGTPVTVSWSSSNATQVYINNIGFVSPSGSTQVASQATTDYSCYGYSAAYGNGPWDTTNTTLTVTPPATPGATITASSTTIYTVQSDNITADYTAVSGDPLTADNIDSPLGTGLGANTNPTISKTINFSTMTPGTYTFYVRAKTNYYTTWQTLASVNVTVLKSCTPATQYSCSGQTIMASSTSATCQTTQTPGTTCVAPQFCSAGSSTCVSPPPADTPPPGGAASLTGHLVAKPNLVAFNGLTTVYWDVSNVTNCQVSAADGTLWSGATSATSTCASKNNGGCITLPIIAQTIYTLSCNAFDGSNYTETATVNVLPSFLEQ